MNRKELLYIPAALAIGGGMWFVMNLDPVWWLAWILPGLLFAIALRTEAWTARGLVALAALIGASSNLGYFLKVMPLFAVMIVLLLQTLVWVFIFEAARRIVKAWDATWTVLALPVVSVAVDTLLAHFTPDGNFGSLAYTQAEMLPMAQFAALFGTGGILFLLMLVNSALAFALTYGLKIRGAAADVRQHGAGHRARGGIWRVALAERARRTVGVLWHRVGRRFHRFSRTLQRRATSGLNTRHRCRSWPAAAPRSYCCPRR